MSRPLGARQKGALSALNRFGSWPSGWVYGTPSQTRTILDSLVKRGLVARSDDDGKYRPTLAGMAAVHAASPAGALAARRAAAGEVTS
jgi:hypothetical protein